MINFFAYSNDCPMGSLQPSLSAYLNSIGSSGLTIVDFFECFKERVERTI